MNIAAVIKQPFSVLLIFSLQILCSLYILVCLFLTRHIFTPHPATAAWTKTGSRQVEASAEGFSLEAVSPCSWASALNLQPCVTHECLLARAMSSRMTLFFSPSQGSHGSGTLSPFPTGKSTMRLTYTGISCLKYIIQKCDLTIIIFLKNSDFFFFNFTSHYCWGTFSAV